MLVTIWREPLQNNERDVDAAVAEELRQSVEQLVPDGVRVTASIGAAQRVIRVDPEAELNALIAEADGFLYAAKRAGNDQARADVVAD